MRIACVLAAAAPCVLYIVVCCGSSAYLSWLTILGVIPPAIIHLKNYLFWCKSPKLGMFGGGIPEFDDGEGTYRRELRSAAPTRIFPPPLDPPPGFLADFGDTFVMMKSSFRFIDVKRFIWWFFCYVPLLEVSLLLVASVLIKDQAADKNSDVSLIFTPGPTWAIRFFCLVNVRSVARCEHRLQCFALVLRNADSRQPPPPPCVRAQSFAWCLISFGILVGGNWKLSRYNTNAWKEAKREFEAVHGTQYVDAIWGMAQRNAVGMTQGNTMVQLLIAAMAFVVSFAAQWGTFYLLSSKEDHSDSFFLGTPLEWSGPVAAIILLSSFALCFFRFWGLFSVYFCTLGKEYLAVVIAARLLGACTDRVQANYLGVPHLALDNVEDLWRWFKLRKLMVSKRFDQTYCLCSPAIATLTLMCVLCIAIVVTVILFFHKPILGGVWSFFSVTTGTICTALIFVLAIVATVYSACQNHANLLAPARMESLSGKVTCLTCGKEQTQEAGSTCITPDCGATVLEPQRYQALATAHEEMRKSILSEPYCPHIGGIAVRPTYFYAFVGYAISAAIAIIVKVVL